MSLIAIVHSRADAPVCVDLSQRRMARVPVCDRLERMANPKQQIFGQVFSYQLETDRSTTLVKAAVHPISWKAAAT
jgi:hypothetical protein